MKRNSSLFTRVSLLHLLLYYAANDTKPRVSIGYISSMKGNYWNPLLSTLEALAYPLGINLCDFIRNHESDSTLSTLTPSKDFLPIIHDRRKLLRVIQQMMKERTGSNQCRALLKRNLGTDLTYVGCDFRSRSKTITMLKVEEYSWAAGLCLSDVFRRYMEVYGCDERNLDYSSYPTR